MFERTSMNWQFRALLVLFVLSLAGGLIWSANHYHSMYLAEQKRADAAEKEADGQRQVITTMQQHQKTLAALDKTHTEALNAAESENDALRRQLAAGARRMYVQGKCPGTGTKAASGGMGNATAVELSATAEQNVLDIRAGIISDRQKLKYLQDYIRQECLP